MSKIHDHYLPPHHPSFVLPEEFQHHVPYMVEMIYRYLLDNDVSHIEFVNAITEMHAWLETNLGNDRVHYYKWSFMGADASDFAGCKFHTTVSFIHAEDALAFKLTFGKYI